MSCLKQRRGFDPPLGRIFFPVEEIFFPLELTWVLWLDEKKKPVTYVKISPRMVKPRDKAGERRRRTGTWVGWLDEKNGHIRKNLTQNGETQRQTWGTQKKNWNDWAGQRGD